MCTGMEIAALAMAAGGTAASMSAAEEQADERKQAALQGIEEESRIQDRANLRTKGYVEETFDPSKRATGYEQGVAEQEKSFGELLAKQAGEGQGDISEATTGALSDSYTRGKAQAATDAATRSRNLSRLLARGGATSNLFGKEALSGADYSSDMLGLGVDSQLAARGAQNRFNAAGSAGGDMALLGGLLSGASGAVGSMRKKPLGSGG